MEVKPFLSMHKCIRKSHLCQVLWAVFLELRKYFPGQVFRIVMRTIPLAVKSLTCTPRT